MSSKINNRDKVLLEYTEKMALTGTWELDLLTNEIYWSDGVYIMVGDEPQSYKIDFQIGLNVIHPDDREKALAEMNAAISEGNDYNITKRFLLKDGTIKHISSRATVIKDESGKPRKLIGVFQDISEHVELLNKLRANERRYKALVENGADAIAIIGADGNPTYVSPSISNVLGYSEEEALKLNLFEIIHPADRDAIISKMGEVMQHPGVPIYGATSRTRHKDGSWRWLEATITNLIDDPDIRGIVDNFRDVSEWMQMQSMLDTATSMNRVGSWELDMVNSNTNSMFWSPMLKNILEVDDDYNPTLTGGFEFYVGESKTQIQGAVDELIKTGKPFDLELQIVTAKGNLRWIRCIGESERDANNACLRIYGSYQDIHRQKVMEDSLRKLNHQLEDHARELALSNKELEQFAYVTSHDLQEPLRMINSFLVLLQKKYGDKLDTKAQQYIHFATDGALRMRQIILDLLEFSRVGVHLDRIQNVDFNDVFNEVRSLQRRKIEDLNAIVSTQTLPIIETYRSPMVQVFHNLIGNALKYSEPSRRPRIHVSFEEHEEHYKFFVSDNGIGIESEYHDKIFIIFQRLHTKEMYSGTGMGLAIVKKIVENLGGAVGVESVLGEGSTFWFTIPK